MTVTITNTGEDDLIDPTLTDTTIEGVDVGEFTCAFTDTLTVNGREHTALLVGESATCTAILPGMGLSDRHVDKIQVTAAGIRSQKAVQDTDTLTVTTPETTPFILEKVDGSTKELISGAEFSLTDQSTGESQTLSGDASTWDLSLKPGLYTLTETKAPEGYGLLPMPMVIEVLKSANENGEFIEVRSTLSDEMVSTTEDGVTTLTVSNFKKGTLPVSGGSDVVWILAAGLLVVLLAAALEERRRRRGTAYGS